MTIALLGATGRTGRPFLKTALAAGHHVRALTRSLPSLDIDDPKLEAVQGDATDAASVDALLEGADAVVCVLGHTKGGAKDVLTCSLKHIVSAMQKRGIRRLIYLTGAGVRFPEDNPRIADRLVRGALKVAAPALLSDSVAACDVVKQSDVDWTIVRGPMLTEKPGTKNYRVDYVGGSVGNKAARETVAFFILDELTDNIWIGKAPVVSE